MWDRELRTLIATAGSRHGPATPYDRLLRPGSDDVDQTRIFALARAHKVVAYLEAAGE